MILYHGTYTNFDSIELDKCRPFKDFGQTGIQGTEQSVLFRYRKGTRILETSMSGETQRQFLVNYVIDQMTAFLMEDCHITLGQALDIIYSSRVYDLLQDDTVDLASNSPAYIYELLKQEIGSATG